MPWSSTSTDICTIKQRENEHKKMWMKRVKCRLLVLKVGGGPVGGGLYDTAATS